MLFNSFLMFMNSLGFHLLEKPRTSASFSYNMLSAKCAKLSFICIPMCHTVTLHSHLPFMCIGCLVVD